MLLRFKFTNFSSYRDTQEISWVASSLKHPSRKPTEFPGLEHGVLPCCAIYGANASGKSNAIKALKFFTSAIFSSFTRWQPNQPIPRDSFRRSTSSPHEESRFELDFAIGQVRYQYGFAIDDFFVLEEWLYTFPSARKQVWFHRKQGSSMEFGRNLKGANRSTEQITRDNVLFFSSAAFHAHDQLNEIISWLFHHLRSHSDHEDSGLQELARLQENESRDSLVRLIQAADLGVVGLNVETAAETPPLNSLLPSALEFPFFSPPQPIQVRLLHQIEGAELEFPEDKESDGTLVYLSRLPSLLRQLQRGGLYVVDEIDRSLHPSLCLQIVKLFLSESTNPKGAQILFTTHDSSLLSSGDLRRDEIWFAEKDQDGASYLRPLSDYSPRPKENLEKGYLQGRYGGVPLLNEAAFWAAFQVKPSGEAGK